MPEALLDLLAWLDSSGFSGLALSGYTLREIQSQPLGPAILSHLDVLIAGRYVAARHDGHGLLGSSNQRIHLLTERHTQAEFRRVPQAEFILHADGTITLTGISPSHLDSSARTNQPIAATQATFSKESNPEVGPRMFLK